MWTTLLLAKHFAALQQLCWQVNKQLLQIVEKLYRLKWGQLDGLGALVISPTRELALQIFNELRKIGKRHEFSAGLMIGGKNLKEEQERVAGSPPDPDPSTAEALRLLVFVLYHSCQRSLQIQKQASGSWNPITKGLAVGNQCVMTLS